MSENIDIELTDDGSHTLYVPALNEHYHSVNGAIQESTHVYINTGLHNCQKRKINILEIGFGTGLNAFLTLLDVLQSGKSINYISLEAYPLPLHIIERLNYPQQIRVADEDLFKKLHLAEWNESEDITSAFRLTKIETDFTHFDFKNINCADIIYFDAFAPDKQPEMWTQQLFDKLYTITKPDGILVTYCAKGEVRRMLQRSGFTVERLPGPPGKREMLRASK